MRQKDTRHRIVESALRLFSERGYLSATTKDIAKEAGIAEVTLFRYFQSKESLFEEVINTYSFLPMLKGLVEEVKALPYKDALKEIAHRFLDTLHMRKGLVRIMFSEITLYPAKTRQIHRRLLSEMFETLAAYFRRLQAQGILRRFEPNSGARAFLGMFFSFFIAQEFHLRGKLKKHELESLIGEYVEIFIKGTVK